MLHGVTMGIVRRQLEKLGVPQRWEKMTLKGLENLAGAAVMNSWTPGVAVSAIASTTFPVADAFVRLLHKAYQAEPAILA